MKFSDILDEALKSILKPQKSKTKRTSVGPPAQKDRKPPDQSPFWKRMHNPTEP